MADEDGPVSDEIPDVVVCMTDEEFAESLVINYEVRFVDCSTERAVELGKNAVPFTFGKADD